MPSQARARSAVSWGSLSFTLLLWAERWLLGIRKCLVEEVAHARSVFATPGRRERMGRCRDESRHSTLRACATSSHPVRLNKGWASGVAPLLYRGTIRYA